MNFVLDLGLDRVLDLGLHGIVNFVLDLVLDGVAGFVLDLVLDLIFGGTRRLVVRFVLGSLTSRVACGIRSLAGSLPGRVGGLPRGVPGDIRCIPGRIPRRVGGVPRGVARGIGRILRGVVGILQECHLYRLCARRGGRGVGMRGGRPAEGDHERE